MFAAQLKNLVFAVVIVFLIAPVGIADDNASGSARVKTVSFDKIMEIASKLNFKDLRVYNEGVYGKYDGLVTFMSTLDRVPDYQRLYWVMVRVLSEKYGCFIKKKERDGDRYQFTCKDRRKIVMKRSRGSLLIRFFARQYMPDGTEIVVKNHKAVPRLAH